MLIAEVLERVDALYPNTYTNEEKVRWCYDVSCGIRDSIVKVYRVRTQTIEKDGDLVLMPDGINFSDIDSVYVNGLPVGKVDGRSLAGGPLPAGSEVRVVYKVMPEPYSIADGDIDPDVRTEMEAPYDSLYVDYVCAQIAFYQNDMADYNKFISMYNEKLLEFAKHYQQTAPVVQGRGYYNLWQ